jgi:hypothetical protein
VPAASVYEDPPRRLPKEQAPAIGLFFGKEEKTRNTDEMKERRMFFRFVIYVRPDTNARVAADLIHEEAHNVLMADGESLGKRCSLIEDQGWEWALYDADTDAGELSANYECKYHTFGTSLT